MEGDLTMSEHLHNHSDECSGEHSSCDTLPEHHHEHHHHDESCSCGHHHEHDHEHKHDESCSCGHHHDHEHKHDESCSCGHHHDHEHHDESCSCGHHHEHHEHHHHDESCSCGHHHDHEHHDHSHHHPTAEAPVPKDVKGTKRIYILENLGCANCAAKMESKIQQLPGVSFASITFATKQLRIYADHPDKLLPQIQEICSSIESGVKVCQADTSPTKKEEDHEDDTKDLVQISTGAVLFAAGIILSKFSWGAIPSILVSIIAYVILGGKIVWNAAKNIIKGQVFDENFLMSIATLGAFAIQEYHEAVGVMLFYRIGEYFEHKAVEKSRSQIMEAVDMRPEVVNRMHGEQTEVIPAEDAQVGDLLLIRPGDRIPLDGVIVEGNSRLDTSPITGEPVPVTVQPGSEAISGCVNTSGQLILRVEKPLQDSMVSRILDSVENAAASKPKIDRFITRFARIYTPVVVIIALATAILPSIVTGDWNYWVYTALTFLVMSCPCALVLSVPLAFFSGIGAGSKQGILFKGGLSIEALGNVKAIVMDKTGTITEGNFKLQKIISTSDFSEDDLLRLCASCEQHSTHPIGISIVAAAKENNMMMLSPEHLEEIAGHGIIASIAGNKILCGNQKLMEQYDIAIPALQETAYGAEVFLAINNEFAGYLLISDTIKADAKTAIRQLKNMGLYTVMLTGDSQKSAVSVANETGIQEVHAKLLPQNKLEILAQIREKQGAVMFIGDGINDAPVLAGADVGAAMGNGADAAIEAADAVFMKSHVNAIAESIKIARAVNHIALQNVVFALIIKAIVMVLGLLGFANMWMAVFADTGVAMLCVLNSIRILYQK